MNIADKRNYKIFKFLLPLFLILPVLPVRAITAQEAFLKGRNAISAAKTISANFTMKVNGNTVKGKLSAKGNKFSIISDLTSNWYNGTDLYTYNKSKSETTIFRPSASELAQVNPLLYLKTASEFNVLATKTKKAGVETVVLTPKSSGSGIRSVTIDLDSKTFLPKFIKLVPASGNAIDLTVSNLKLNANISDSSFTYPQKSYPKAKIIDMR